MNDHDHRGEYADQRHDHDPDYAPLYHRHYDLEREDGRLAGLLRDYESCLSQLRADLESALGRIRSLEGDTPQARQLQLEADQAAADLAASGYDERGGPVGADRHGPGCLCPYCPGEPEGEPPTEDYDPGPEADDEGGMSEYRYLLTEDYERGQS